MKHPQKDLTCGRKTTCDKNNISALTIHCVWQAIHNSEKENVYLGKFSVTANALRVQMIFTTWNKIWSMYKLKMYKLLHCG